MVERGLGDGSILIVPHRFPSKWSAWEKRTGVYNTGFLAFRRDESGLAALRWWREKCLEWCYDREEDGKYGDQLYLDDWPDRFNGVRVLEDARAGLAPWNDQKHRLERREGTFLVDGQAVAFYHYESLELYLGMTILRRLGFRRGTYGFTPGPFPLVWRTKSWWEISRQRRRVVWQPYARELASAIHTIRSIDPGYRAAFRELGKGDIALEAIRPLIPSRVRRSLRRRFEVARHPGA
jgi:hypothetical protein